MNHRNVIDRHFHMAIWLITHRQLDQLSAGVCEFLDGVQANLVDLIECLDGFLGDQTQELGGNLFFDYRSFCFGGCESAPRNKEGV